MLAVGLFAAGWVIVALGLFAIAMRGGGHRRVNDAGRRGTGAALSLFIATVAVFGIALPLLLITGNHDNASAQVGGLKLTAAEKNGREVFGAHCAVCHTLAAANAAGKVGPDLDILRPADSLILHTIANGCLSNAPSGSAQNCLGQGVMPADVVQGRDAQDVAAFVARVAGNE
ncbi:MAG: c-type cytochrome [Solirubrobacteraceae bacterium]